VLIGIAMVGIGTIRSTFEGMNAENPEMPPAFIAAIIFVGIASIVLIWIYNAAMESSKHQGTLGKMALGLIVTDSQGRPIGFSHTGSICKLSPGCSLRHRYAMAGFTEKKQALHDMIAGCLVEGT
jgi:uncharacterized RDD family membrane protein YckC